ncbi:MAG TPA: TetR/AcrR family transcriptional regulator [Bacteroidales bacterium]|nr:TetR/AcrR family transcriptional regulator [Bacteroidales bacterium]HOK99740.1 TetR/AcrR family transcriptional regulator [Bacteroidales bacterium]
MSSSRDYIIDKAYELFLNKSYEGVSISDISEAVGMTKGALYHHFTNKEDLFKAVIDKYLVFPDVQVDPETITLSAFNDIVVNEIHRMLRNMFAPNVTFVPIHYITMISDALRHYPGFKEDKERYIEEKTATIRRVIENAIMRQEIRSDIDTNTMARLYLSIAIGLAGNLIIKNYSVDESITLLRMQINQLYQLLKR